MARNLFWMRLRRFFLQLVVVCESGPPIFCMFRLYVDLLTQRAGYAIDDIYGDACKVVGDFSGLIGSLDC